MNELQSMIGENKEWVSLAAMGINGVCGNFSPKNIAILTQKTVLRRQAQSIMYVRLDHGISKNNDSWRVPLWRLYLEERAFETFGVQPNPYHLFKAKINEMIAGLTEEVKESISAKDIDALVRIYVRNFLKYWQRYSDLRSSDEFFDNTRLTLFQEMEGAGLLEKFRDFDISNLSQLVFTTLNTDAVKKVFGGRTLMGAFHEALEKVDTLEGLETVYAAFFRDHLNRDFVPSLGLFRITDLSPEVIYKTLQLPPEEVAVLEAMQTNETIATGKDLSSPLLSEQQETAVRSLLNKAIQQFESSPLFTRNKAALTPSLNALKEQLVSKLTTKYRGMTVGKHNKKPSYYQWKQCIEALNYFSQIGLRLHELPVEALETFRLDFEHADWTGCDQGLATKLRSQYELVSSSPFSCRVFRAEESSAEYLSGKDMGTELQNAIEKELAAPPRERIRWAQEAIDRAKEAIKYIVGGRLGNDVGANSGVIRRRLRK